MNSLKTKLIGLISIILIIIIGTASYLNLQGQKTLFLELTQHNLLIITKAIKHSIKNAMIAGRSQEIQNILSSIKDTGSITSIRIFNNDGQILSSGDKNEIGKNIDPSKRVVPNNGKHEQPSEHINEDVLGSISEIRNQSECHGCHDATKEILGTLEVDMSLKHLNDFMSTMQTNSINATIIIILVIILIISLFLILYVDKPIKQIIASMHEIKAGNFNKKSYISSSTEMKLLSTNYNNMIKQLDESIKVNIQSERELITTKEKLKHHSAIHTMNIKLEEQLRKIELMNTSMEERIEEIEEANYKIADLANELEDKNTTLEKAVARLSTLHKIGLGINSTIELDTLFSLVIKAAMETLNAQIGYITTYCEKDNGFKLINMHGHSHTVSDNEIIPETPRGISTWVVNNRKPILIEDISKSENFNSSSLLGFERKTIICVPLIIKEEIIGTITAVNKTDDSVFSNEDMELLSTIATQASIAIKNAQLYNEQQQTYLNTIHALVSAIEASDSYTRGHSERVTRYSVELAKKLELPSARINIIERAAILHDIGKIGIDISLLNKQGKLTPEDIDILQKHPTIGVNILEPIEFLSDVRICISQHHERYDGKGYPNKTLADELLLESRILTIADAFDAMTSDRPYRKALKMPIAIKELHDNAGSQFDPELVPYFVEILKSGKFSFAHCPDYEEPPTFH